MKMRSNKAQLRAIINNDFGVRSGVYTAIEPSVSMKMDERGEYQYIFKKELSERSYSQLLKVDMMSDKSSDEGEISKELFGSQKSVKYDQEIGYFTNLYAGHAIVGGFRERASSGGMCSWVLSELLKKKVVDGVIHFHPVSPTKNGGKLFKYTISRSQEDINKGAKSRYYPGELSDVLAEVKSKEGKYVVVGIPEFITELRLLARVDPIYKERIPIMLGLICGHQKTAKYVESLAWQFGIKPGDLEAVDFRIKQPERKAMDYLHEFTGKINGGEVATIRKSHAELFGEVWAHGFFKSKFSDFSDNVFNENADAVFGDAWLPQYNKDGKGNNVVIIRNKIISDIIKQGIKSKSLKLDIVDTETIKQSQRGLIHHGRDELGYRISKQKSKGYWTPKKRFAPKKVSLIRKHIQDLRYCMARESHEVYQEALKRNDWFFFKSTMLQTIRKYNELYRLKGGVLVQQRHKTVKADLDYVIDRLRSSVRVRTRIRNLKHKARIRTRIRKYAEKEREKRAEKIRYNMINRPHGAIVTLTDYFNYGNMLQRYALQRFLQKKGYRFISYAQEAFDVSDKKFDRLRNTIPFVQQRIYRKPYDVNDDYKYYITGSDQVWRKWGGDGGDDPFANVRYFMFDFIKNDQATRIAYAASFGQSDILSARLTEEFMDSVKPLIKKMNAVSVREVDGAKLVKKYWDVDASVTVDPTMLLDSKDYDALIQKPTMPLREPKSCFAYILGSSDNREDCLRKISKSLNADIDTLYLKEDDKLPSVEQWIMSIKAASFVVTDSFHGMVFCIIYKTPFIVLENEFGGASRIVSLLSELGIQDRFIMDKDLKGFNVNELNDINWRHVSRRLNNLRGRSSKWLLKALSEGGR